MSGTISTNSMDASMLAGGIINSANDILITETITKDESTTLEGNSTVSSYLDKEPNYAQGIYNAIKTFQRNIQSIDAAFTAFDDYAASELLNNGEVDSFTRTKHAAVRQSNQPTEDEYNTSKSNSSSSNSTASGDLSGSTGLGGGYSGADLGVDPITGEKLF